MNDVAYPLKLNNQAVEVNIAWMDPWFRRELSSISERNGIALEESTRRLLGLYRALEGVVEEEAVKLGLINEPTHQGTNLTIVAPDLPTYLVVLGLGNLVKTYQNGQNTDKIKVQQVFSGLNQIVKQTCIEDDELDLTKLTYCSNSHNVTAYNWLFVAPIVNRLYLAQMDYKSRLRQVDKQRKRREWYSMSDEEFLLKAFEFISYEMLSTLIGNKRDHYSEEIERRLAKRFEDLIQT